MTKDEAIIALRSGKKLTHVFFTRDEWIKQNNAVTYVDENGCILSIEGFWSYRTGYYWENGWSIIED